MKRLSFFILRYRLALSVVALALLTAAGVTEWFQSFAKVLTPVSKPGTLNTLQSERRDRVEGEVITVLPTGFQPSQITRPRGQFLILVDNRSDSDDLTLRLISVAGPMLREMKQTREKKIVTHLEDSPPGEYLLTEASHPDWVCRITITPH